MPTQGHGNGEINTFAIAKNFIVPESDHPITLGLNDRRTRGVGLGFVLATINLDDQLGSMTGEISDEMSDRDLTAEVEVGEMLA